MLSLHDALPISVGVGVVVDVGRLPVTGEPLMVSLPAVHRRQVVLERGRAAVVAVGAVPGEPVPESSGGERLLRAAAEEQVAQIAIVSTADDGVAGHLGAVRPVVGGGAVDRKSTRLN